LFSNPILVGEGADIIAGHGRLAAARKLGLTEAPVVILRGLCDAQRRQLVLADNKIALNASWDAEMLSLELADLSAIGADLSMLGFTTKELSAALSRVKAGLTDEDEVPEVAEVAVSQPGDIWQLGPHRVACGDSRASGLVQALFAGTVPQLMVTDPPYGVEYDPQWRHRRGVNNSARKGKIKNDEIADWTPTWNLFPGEIAYVWHGALRSSIVAESLANSGFAIRAQIIWAKERLVMSQGDYHWQHEPCWYAVRKKGYWAGDRKQTTLWTIPTGGQDAETKHATQKPVECMRRPMLNNSSPGQAIYEPFLGSGTTLIAAHSCERVCFGIEIDPLFVDVAIRRWQAFTGEKAKRANDSALFEELLPTTPPVEEASVMRGRRPKPSRIKALTGNPGKRPLNAHEPRPVPALPECPPELSPAGRQEWGRLSAELSKLNLITHLDRGAPLTHSSLSTSARQPAKQCISKSSGSV
jgi:DNA modification methylase